MNIHMLLELGSFIAVNILVTYLTVMYLELLEELDFIIILIFMDNLDHQILSLILRKNLREFLDDFIYPFVLRI